MTRDEAIDAFNSVNTGSFGTNAWIDRFVALGMLKIDEPNSGPSPTYRAFEAIFEWVPSLDYVDFQKLIDGAGLKIVEK